MFQFQLCQFSLLACSLYFSLTFLFQILFYFDSLDVKSSEESGNIASGKVVRLNSFFVFAFFVIVATLFSSIIPKAHVL